MPDHVRFLAAPEPKAKSADSFLSEWKEWTANGIERLSLALPVWAQARAAANRSALKPT